MFEIRVTTPEEYRAASDVAGAALLHAPRDDGDWEKVTASWAASDSLSAWDGVQCVGHAAGYRVETVVPGGARVPTSAVARVGVLPTYRRMGVASGLMRQLLLAAAGRGQVLASLRASEAVIYGRYGFGVAGDGVEVAVDPLVARPVRGAAGGSMRLLPAPQIIETVAPIYERVALTAGVISRPDWLWERYLAGALAAGGDAEFVAVHSDSDDADDGFVHYGVKWRTTPGTLPSGEGEVFDLWGASPGVELALWSYLCDIDLVRTWAAEERPVDDLIRLACRNMRGHLVKIRYDEQWLRLLDVDAALSARTYGDAVDGVTIAVGDDLLAVNEGVWRVDPKGATRVELLAAEADLAVDVATLASTYLGGFRWSMFGALGKVEERKPGALTLADSLFLTSRAPFCGSFF